MSGVYNDPGATAKIQAQNALLKQEYATMETTRIQDTKTRYQTEMVESLKTANLYLLFFYYFLCMLILVLFVEQYFRGIIRNYKLDAGMFTLFLLFPLVIYHVETYIYFGVMYMISLIYGSAYVFNFDKALLNTDFYVTPNSNTANTAMPSAITTNFT